MELPKFPLLTDATAADTVIEVSDLVTHYGERQILNGVNLEIQRGEIMVIMGGSGSGKSTLLRHLMALEQATSGSIKLLGHELTQLSQRDLYTLCRKIGVSFQGGAPCSMRPGKI